MTNQLKQHYENIIEEWRTIARGRGYLIFKQPDYCPIVNEILRRLYAKNPHATTHIICGTKNDKRIITNYITDTSINAENSIFKSLIKSKKIHIVESAMVQNSNPRDYQVCTIFINCNMFSDMMQNFMMKSGYHLACFTAWPSNKTNLDKLSKRIGIKELDLIEKEHSCSPVEERRIALTLLTDADKQTLDNYDAFISQSIQIFDSIDGIQMAREGDKRLNISSTDYCYRIARHNGWNEHLDMSLEYNKLVDSMYNPINLRERAELTYSIFRKRRVFLAENDCKLPAILDIVNTNRFANILIINFSATFASKVTEYINEHLFGSGNWATCLNYHDQMPDIPATDENGDFVYYKTGENKGKRKVLKAKAQRTLYSSLFANRTVNVLSTNNAPDKELSGEVDIMIITSPLCETSDVYRYRLSKVTFTGNPIVVYKLYCKGTVEETKLNKEKQSPYHKIMDNGVDVVNFDENSGNIVVDF